MSAAGPTAPLTPGEALAAAQELQPYLEQWHQGDNSGMPTGCAPPPYPVTLYEAEGWARRTFGQAVENYPPGPRPSSMTYISLPGYCWTDEVPDEDEGGVPPPAPGGGAGADGPSSLYHPPLRNPDRHTCRRPTLWLLRDLRDRLAPRRGEEAWLPLARALDRILDSPAWQIRRHVTEAEWHDMQGEQKQPPDDPRVWHLSGRQVEPRLIEQLVEAARLVMPVPVAALENVASGEVKQPPPSEDPPNHPTLLQVGEWDLKESGYASYAGTRFPLEGANRRLLARLIRAKGRAVHADHLIDAANLAIERGDLKSYISRLRGHLRTHLPNLQGDPIPYRDPDAYQLALQ
jgi:hypothetical protein